MIKTYDGACHCGALSWKFHTTLEPTQWVIRCCQCSFCRAHATRCTSDPNGSVEFWGFDSEALVRYRFGLRTADFIVCGKCGVYLGALMKAGDMSFATLNLNTLTTFIENLPSTTPISYDSEHIGDRVGRRERRWTPVKRTS